MVDENDITSRVLVMNFGPDSRPFPTLPDPSAKAIAVKRTQPCKHCANKGQFVTKVTINGAIVDTDYVPYVMVYEFNSAEDAKRWVDSGEVKNAFDVITYLDD